jgi:hypothetical protein
VTGGLVLLAGCWLDLLAHPTTLTAIAAASTTANNSHNMVLFFDMLCHLLSQEFVATSSIRFYSFPPPETLKENKKNVTADFHA